MFLRLSIAAMLAAVITVPLTQGASRAEPVRISLKQARALPEAERLADGQRLLLPESPRRASAAPTLPDESWLSERLDLHLEPALLAPHAQPGQRLGHGDVVFSLPLGEWLRLRTGVRVDYENLPRDGAWQVEGAPTVGVGLRF